MRLNLIYFLAVVAVEAFAQAAPANVFLDTLAAAGWQDKGGAGAKSAAGGATAKGAKSTAAAATSKAVPSSTGTPKAGAGAGKVITIVVGSTNRNKSLAFTPNDVKAAPGDIVQFQFSMMNHTVTQSTFDAPCEPVQASDPTAAGIHSGFVPVSGNEATVNTFDVPINNTQPMFIYCAQGPHCQLGMVMTINANTNQTFAAYKSKAAAAKANVPAALMKGGVMGSIPAANAVPPPV